MNVGPDPIDFDISADDIMAFRRYYFFRSAAGRRRLMWRRIIWFLVLSPSGFASVSRSLHQPVGTRSILAVTVVATAYALLAWFIPALWIKLGPDTQSLSAQGHWQLTATPEGLSHVHIAGSALMPWTNFNRVERSESALYLFAGERAIVAPVRAFASELSADQFASYAQEHIRGTGALSLTSASS